MSNTQNNVPVAIFLTTPFVGQEEKLFQESIRIIFLRTTVTAPVFYILPHNPDNRKGGY